MGRLGFKDENHKPNRALQELSCTYEAIYFIRECLSDLRSFQYKKQSARQQELQQRSPYWAS